MVGLARFRAHEPAAAIAPFTRALALAPSSATVRFDLASALYQAGRFADAEARYVEAAARDAKIAPLALLNAGLAALDGGNPERAIAHLQKAEAAARAGGQEPVADEAHATLQSFTRRSSHAAAPELQRLTHAGTEALHARRYGEAAASYHRAYDVAVAEGASAGDRAELQYDLGHALWRAGDLVAAARALESAVALAPHEAEFHYLLGLVHFDAGADRDAKDALVRALALGLPAGEAKRAGDILRALAETRRGETSRFFFEMRAAFGLDTNVPQSGTLVTAAHPGGEPTTAPFLEGDVDFFWRPAGNARNGFSVEYRFAQLAYLSEDLHLYSLQEHDSTLTGAWTPTPRLTLELGGDGYVLFTGVESFTPFQTGVSVGPRISVREPHGFETRLRAQHIYKRFLDDTYDYLTGNRDEAGAGELWRDPKDRVSLGYLFAKESIGVQKISLGLLNLPLATASSSDPNDVYFIPYSYTSHEVALGGARDLPHDFYATATVRYEHRDYDGSANRRAQRHALVLSRAQRQSLRPRRDGAPSDRLRLRRRARLFARRQPLDHRQHARRDTTRLRRQELRQACGSARLRLRSLTFLRSAAPRVFFFFFFFFFFFLGFVSCVAVFRPRGALCAAGTMDDDHPQASQELGAWVRRRSDTAERVFEWDAHHPERAREFVTWTNSSIPGSPNRGLRGDSSGMALLG